MSEPLIIFIYSHEDDSLIDRTIRPHIGGLGSSNVDFWDDRRLSSGQDWLPEGLAALRTADMTVLLLSTTFLASDFIYNKVILLLQKRHRQGNLIVIPVVLGPCYWQSNEWIQSLQVWPLAGRSLLEHSAREYGIAALFTHLGETSRKLTRKGFNQEVKLSVQQGDATLYQCDVLVLKYAQAAYGVDAAVVEKLDSSGINGAALLPEPSAYSIIDTQGALNAKFVLFVGVNDLTQFGYQQIREFSRKALATLATEVPNTQHVATTLHGAGFGLDEAEAFDFEIAGVCGRDFGWQISR